MLHTPLSQSELAALEAFLMSEATSEACMNLEELDGFFTALICGPETVLSSEYLPTVWGQEDEAAGPMFESDAQAQQMMSLLMRYRDTIAATLKAGEPYAPLLYEYKVEGTHRVSGRDWARGFMRGAFLRKEAWQLYIDDEENASPFMAIIALAEELDPEQRAKMLEVLPVCILMIYRYWRAHRTMEPMA